MATSTAEATAGLRVAVLGIKSLPARGGADRVVERLLENDSGRHAYTVYLLRDGTPPLQCTPHRHYVYVPAVGGKHLRPFSYFFLCAMHYLVKGRYDVAHVHNSDFGVFTPLLKRRRRVRVVGTFHGDPYERAKWGRVAQAFLRLSERMFVRSCDALTSVAVSKEVPGRVVTHIPNGVDSRSGQPGEAGFDYEGLGLVRGGYVLFACGRLDATKGLHHLLAAYRELPQARLLVVGDFSHDRAYAERIDHEAANLPQAVLHKQLLPRETLMDVLSNAAVFVFPSEVEAMSMMLLEALACESLVVCSDIPENVAVVGEDYPFLFRSGDAASLRDVLGHALAPQPDDRDRLRRVHDRAAATFRWEEIAADYERLYEGGAVTREPRIVRDRPRPSFLPRRPS
jgi:glycosyltransferase involved in cell wall biosynthesis